MGAAPRPSNPDKRVAMKIGIFGNRYQESHLDELGVFISLLRERGDRLYVDRNFAEYLCSNSIKIEPSETADTLPADTEIVVSIGGDGTFLKTAAWVGSLEIPVMGINTGHLGYLTGFSFSNPKHIYDALEGRCEISPRMLLKLSSPHIPEDFSPFALNEISISKGDTTSMVEIKAAIDGRYLADYLADGLVVSTPTGSTAYNLSCGGPIMQPTLESLVLSPIAPHSLTLRPLVVSSRSKLQFEVRSRGAESHIGVDGRTFAVPADGEVLIISEAPYKVKVVQPAGNDFAAVLRSKLGWGG